MYARCTPRWPRRPTAGTSGWSAGESWSASSTTHGLLDELILGVAPVFLGAGAPLLPRRITAPTLRLTEVTQYGETFVTLRYAVDKPAA